MRRIILVFLSLVILAGMTACGAEVALPEEPTFPVVVNLQITPAVAHWLPQVAACADGISNFGVATQVLPRTDLSLEESDLILRLGERLESDPFVAVMGHEKIVIVAGANVPVTTISLESLQAIYTGMITDWGDVPEVSPGDEEMRQPIKPLSYPEGHEIEILFRRVYLDDAPFSIVPQVYSTIAFFEELIEQHPYGIGYLLESQVPEGVQMIRMTGDETIESIQYVLTVTDQAPTGGLKQLLLCLQNAQ